MENFNVEKFVAEVPLNAAAIFEGSPAPPVLGGGEDARLAYAQFQKASADYAEAQKAIKAGVLARLEGQPGEVYCKFCDSFRAIPETVAADRVRKTSWISAVRKQFAGDNPGLSIEAQKDGKVILGYLVEDISNELTNKRIAAILAAAEGIPGVLTTEDAGELRKLVESAEQNAADIARLQKEKAEREEKISQLRSELGAKRNLYRTLKKSGYTVPVELIREKASLARETARMVSFA